MKDRKISVDLNDIVGQTKNFESLKAFYDFCVNEQTFWQEQQERVNQVVGRNHNYLNVYVTFQQIVSVIEGWRENISEWDENQFIQQLAQLRQNFLNGLQSQWLWSGEPFVEIFILCLMEHGEATASPLRRTSRTGPLPGWGKAKALHAGF